MEGLLIAGIIALIAWAGTKFMEWWRPNPADHCLRCDARLPDPDLYGNRRCRYCLDDQGEPTWDGRAMPKGDSMNARPTRSSFLSQPPYICGLCKSSVTTGVIYDAKLLRGQLRGAWVWACPRCFKMFAMGPIGPARAQCYNVKTRQLAGG